MRRIARSLAAFLIALPATAAWASDFVCPNGTQSRSGTTKTRGLPTTYCVLPTGERHGPYAEWSADGKRTVWGTFADGHEHGVWTMEIPTGPGTTQVVYVVFDHGREVPNIVPHALLPSCAEWNKMSAVARSGTISTLTLVIAAGLTGKPAELNRNKAEVAVCFARRASEREYIRDAKCGDEAHYQEELRASILEVARHCLLPSGAAKE
jgi:hypothetical protein